MLGVMSIGILVILMPYFKLSLEAAETVCSCKQSFKKKFASHFLDILITSIGKVKTRIKVVSCMTLTWSAV